MKVESLTPISNRDRTSPYSMNTISNRQVMRKRKISTREMLVDLVPNSLNWHQESWMADSKENYWWDLGSERVKALHLSSYMIEWNKLQLDDRSLKGEKFELNPLTPLEWLASNFSLQYHPWITY